MLPNLIKAEILISRKCKLNCTGCAMATGKENTRTIEEWKEGLKQASELGCQFFAFYGAEPLEEFEILKALVEYSEKVLNVPCTVITHGVHSDFKEKITELYNVGLKSLTMSYDPMTSDPVIASKARKAKEELVWWNTTFKDIRDTAAVVTLTAENIMFLPEVIQMFTKKNIWTFFDLLHFDRNPGSKCTKIPQHLDVFKNIKKETLLDIFAFIGAMADDGFLIHPTAEFFSQVLSQQLWNCAEHVEFPSFITIDNDGTVRPCDDFYIGGGIDMLSLKEDFNKWAEVQKSYVKEHCKGCMWCTHIQAHSIKAGTLNIDKYVHKKDK